MAMPVSSRNLSDILPTLTLSEIYHSPKINIVRTIALATFSLYKFVQNIDQYTISQREDRSGTGSNQTRAALSKSIITKRCAILWGVVLLSSIFQLGGYYCKLTHK